MIRPNAKPIENITFNGEYAYLKADITVLHSRDKWRTYLREVKKEEIENPIKEITGKFKKNNGTPTSVYAEW
jgi:xeroderma pigmentosum group C-complementing protein